MLTELCQYLRNWFLYSKDDIYGGRFVIRDGTLPPIFLDGEIFAPYKTDGVVTNDGYVMAAKLERFPYIRIIGSRYNDGVHKLSEDGVTDLVDEEFYGEIWILSIPPVIEQLSKDIDDWVAANATAINSPYQSESFGGYSYSKGYNSGGAGGSGTIVTWQSQFAARLALWRKL